MKIAICDDAIKDCERLKKCCEQTDAVSDMEFSLFTSGKELLASLEKGLFFDMVFLDVDMPDENGIHVGNLIRQYDKTVIIIFVTNYSEFAIDAFECEAFRYLLKPCDPEKLNKIMSAAAEKLKILSRYHIIKDRNSVLRVPVSDIFYVEYCQKHVIYHLRDRDIRVADKLSNVCDALCRFGFCQVHQGFLVNLEKIKRFDKYDIVLEDDRTVSVSVRKKTEVMLTYSQYIERYM